MGGRAAAQPAQQGGALHVHRVEGLVEHLLRHSSERGGTHGLQGAGHGGFEPFDRAHVVRNDRAIGTDRFRQQYLRVTIFRGFPNDLVERANEIELPYVTDLRQRRSDPAPVENSEKSQHREGIGLTVQPPDPRAVLRRAQTVREMQQPAVQQPTVVQPRPGVRIVHRGGPLGGQDRVPRIHHLAAPAVRDAVHAAVAALDLDMVGTDEVAAQRLGTGQDFGEVPGGEPVVAVQESEVLAARGVQAGVTGGGQSAVLLVSAYDHPRNLVLGAAQYVRGPVGRTVVDEDEFEVLAGVGPQASQGVGGVCLHVVERHDDRELNHPSHARREPVICLGAGRDGG